LNLKNNQWYARAIKTGFAVGDDHDLNKILEIAGSAEAVLKPGDVDVFSRFVEFVSVSASMTDNSFDADTVVTGTVRFDEAPAVAGAARFKVKPIATGASAALFDSDSIAATGALPDVAWSDDEWDNDTWMRAPDAMRPPADMPASAAMPPLAARSPVGMSASDAMPVPDGTPVGGKPLRCRVCDRQIASGAGFCPHCGSKVVQESPDVALRKVEFSAIAPKKLVKGNYTVIHVIMYEGAFRHIVDSKLRESDEPAQEERSGIHEVKDGSQIKIILVSPDITIEDNTETGTWQGGHLDFSFAVFLSEQYKKRQVLFNAVVYINDVIATKLKFIVKCSSFLEQKIAVTREDILSAFVSYASQDRNRVAAIIQGMKKARPDMDVFFDVDSLRSGDDWERALHREIERRDILFLCWSHFARESKWVDVEWRYALEQKGAESIEPVPLEPPDICPPPKELNHKHFNDKLLYIINAADNSTKMLGEARQGAEADTEVYW